ncbi:hypothetical protein GGQ86_004850 [Xanthobacter flavus]|uniref:Uncharacterized protein n=1 Tax=Xanthobacter flavus TaxID=281 RepID=A0A9W6CUB3_XANFL|nr:hypothetical protein [Xanthobacter flavus]GLI25432.1 hypothetical protein XFLAVUS301_51060 [Xanthobacter flavus]
MNIRSIFAVGMLLVASVVPALADYYSPRMPKKEQARHEFRDVQRNAHPSGPMPQATTQKSVGSAVGAREYK